ncbi:DUF1573 domain-containing protein [Tunicatimonas pelagia]|uniref:DUF1573 domain-containing protein n=1 Tax=Tunicatimonas pelagia TaxID=931531 RepID=UPI0026663115|nr:DUF1573 domain-containing protein [Tunicatimonas pelagia]WKN45551.1 DUF1573 domain-containing protein [Tunicatimonas pelagia]
MKQVGLSLATALIGLWGLSGCDSNAGSKASETEVSEAPATEVAALEEASPTSMESESTANLPKFEFEELNYDFGTITEGEIVEHTFTFTNTGEAPLVIQSTSASCGCTTPSYSREPVAPGETGEVQVKFNSQNRPGVQNKTITITANTEPAVTRLFIKTNVNPKGEETSGPVRK